ncbi:MAG TPA: hypothetical protein VFK05_09035, partial [Polyangiaceae bacterium]|nr:hypothetical protein [Polyangiaceae bacterium]
GCSSTDTPAAPGGAGSSSGGAAAGGTAAGGTAAGGAPAGGSAGSVSVAGSAGSVSAGGSAGGSSVGGSAGSVSAAGSAGTGGGAAVEASFATVKNMIKMKCSSGAGCHTEPGNPLQMPDNDQLYTKVTTYTTQHCGALVNKTTPAQSAIVKVLQGECGTGNMTTPRMPFQSCVVGDTDVGPDAPCIPPDTIAAIQTWIAKGAPQQ